ncbi:MAG TPA: GNAT family N-acetyltransferase [Gemmatimonadales bacterium]|jgi:predicted GNAT family acetyltransferase
MFVEHDLPSRRFTVAGSGGTAVLSYAAAGTDILELYSTYVPPADRGRGIAAQLVQAAVEYARAEGFRIIPSCWYVAVWLRRHPEHADLVAH